ncbi:NAD(P)-dependent oxidoreductase [Bradyrhizobium sp.]|uniref:NAD(P)-dependent oxidoreductase n=1 Tax=Bradyrhizobium sp. TaxID=376 RepID=UPI00260D296A|nr:NAD(P)-dependent oxidoreductase [Bradyrhizobium sp.]
MARLAFIGCGAMGAPMAERLIDAGHTLHIYDPDPAATAPLVALGAVTAPTPRAAAEMGEVAFACLPSPEVSRKVALESDGIVACKDLAAYIEMSTIGSKTIKAIAQGLAETGIAVLDSPVSGGPRGARAGTLSTMVAGVRTTFETVKPLLETVARNVFYIGEEPGLAQVTKLANNMISAAGMAAAFECSAMAVKAGVDARTLIETVNASTGRNSATMDKFPAAVLTRSFDYGGKLSTMYKDVFLCLEEARELNVPMWVGSNVVQLWFHAMTQGRGNDDYTALIKMIEDWAGVVVGGNESGPVDRKPE